jgi:hypothetical protein
VALAAVAPGAAARAAAGEKQGLTMTSEQLVQALQQSMGTNLKSVVLYGSAAAGDFVPGISGQDILIIAGELGPAALAAMSAPLLQWEHAGNPLPQFLTSHELASSADVFPIELMDMRQSRRVLFGPDPLAEMKIDMRLYRVQLERELKTRLLLLRRKYLASSGKAEGIAALMAASLSTFMVLLRATLRLYNDSAPAQKSDALDELAKHVQFDPQPFRAVLELRKRSGPPAADEVESLFSQYLVSIEKVVQAVDLHLHPKT